MQWYVYLITISATVFLGWTAIELLGRPLRAWLSLRRSILEQILALEGILLPKPRETAVSSREIREYDQAIRKVKEAQRIFSNLGSQLLAFGENESVICAAMGFFGFKIAAAGSGLISLSEAYSQADSDRAGLINEIKKALRLIGPAPTSSRRTQRNYLTGKIAAAESLTTRLRCLGLGNVEMSLGGFRSRAHRGGDLEIAAAARQAQFRPRLGGLGKMISAVFHETGFLT